ncbi:P-loop containing nucleoside triphosphate hydrolase [Pseudocohnilembus persalinus]|uniref:Nucleolar GTP-binding protein 2 n=1 Tax=Pseudocohnilembus persalinus TaxID=266149 RepID=A0A0V0QQ82_PSEPJ|nr:P-loop containing nucleoside triphosphate hydrolase [Pseudocohnilembus persalinus]|eukprot:KRX04411.1 P-loop containing nucleoside triphosphate hydrolase [Pseudocohnilembus persalinus]
MPKRSKNDKFQAKNQKHYKQHHGSQHIKSANASTNPDRKLPGKAGDGGPMTHFRTKNTIKRLNMYKEKPDYEKMKIQSTKPARIDSSRKYFGPVRTINQKSLEHFRIEMAQRSHDPRQVLIKAKKLPLNLLVDPVKENKVRILDLQGYEETFGPKSRRKKVKLNTSSYEELVQEVDTKTETYKITDDSYLNKEALEQEKKEEGQKDKRMEAGQSKRIWDELYKVIDSSDVLAFVLDARDPQGTRSKHVEEHIRKNCPHKHLILILNKCDLVPTWVTSRWVKTLSKEYPTLAFHASLNNSFGKGSLVNLLRQFDNFHKDKQNISVGFVGYPNVGKSSVINALKQKRVCKAAPIPGETRVWQYITLTKRIYLIDCPGHVYYNDGKNSVDVVLKGCIRAEKIDDPIHYIQPILEKCKKEDLRKIYQIAEFTDDEDFLNKIAIKKGKLLPGAQPDQQSVAKIVLMDWQRGTIPYYHMPEGYIPEEEMQKIKQNKADDEHQDILENLNKQTEKELKLETKGKQINKVETTNQQKEENKQEETKKE